MNDSAPHRTRVRFRAVSLPAVSLPAVSLPAVSFRAVVFFAASFRAVFLPAALVVAALFLAAPPAGAVEREQLLKVLQGREWTLKAESFTQFGGGVDGALIAIVDDPGPLRAYLRQRALVALRIYPNERVASYLENLVASHRSKFLVRRAFESFAAAFSASQPARMETLAASLLGRNDPHLRVSAARSLRALGSTSAAARFTAYLQSEPEAWARRAARK